MHRIVIHCNSADHSATMVQRTRPGHCRLWRYHIQSPHSALDHCPQRSLFNSKHHFSKLAQALH